MDISQLVGLFNVSFRISSAFETMILVLSRRSMLINCPQKRHVGFTMFTAIFNQVTHIRLP